MNDIAKSLFQGHVADATKEKAYSDGYRKHCPVLLLQGLYYLIGKRRARIDSDVGLFRERHAISTNIKLFHEHILINSKEKNGKNKKNQNIKTTMKSLPIMLCWILLTYILVNTCLFLFIGKRDPMIQMAHR